MGVRRGGKEGALSPSWAAKVCFQTFVLSFAMLLGK